MKPLNTLSGRFLILTAVFVMLAEVLIFVPSVARFRQDYLLARLERAQIASLVLLAEDEINPDLQQELLSNAGVFNVVLRRNEARQLVLSGPLPGPVSVTYDLRDATALRLIRDAMARLVETRPQVIRVLGEPPHTGGLLIEVTLDSAGLRAAMLDYGLRILMLSLVISVITAGLLFFVVQCFLVRPIKRVVGNMQDYAAAPEDARRVITPSAGIKELREAEETLQSLQTQLTGALRQKEHLAQLGAAVAKVNHDLRNILTSAQMFTDRIEMSDDPKVRRMAPKLVNSLTRAVHLCEATLAYGKAEEPPPTLSRLRLSEITGDVLENERMAAAVADGPQVTFRDDVPPDLSLSADPEQLYRVIANLVRNARQAIAATGHAGEVRIAAEERADCWLIRVADTGPGLPEKARDNLFRPFRGGASKGGTGLGLSIARDLIQGHGGRLLLESTGAEGTAFCIELPRSDMH